MTSSPNTTNSNKNIKLHLTGFGPFLNVKENPSSTIMKLVAAYYRRSSSFSDDDEPTKNSINKIVTVLSTDELEVSVQAVQKYIEEEEEKLSHHHQAASEKNEDTGTGPSVIDIFIHFGVNRSSKKTIAIENEAVNCVLIPPNDHSGFKRTYCARISGEHEENDENQKSVPKTPVEVEDDAKTFTADSVSDDKPPTSSSSSEQQHQPLITTLIPSKIKKLTEEICSTVLNRPFRNISKTKTRKVNVESNNNNSNNASSDDIDSSSFQPPEEFCIAPSLDAGKYLCNFIFYLSCLKLSSRQNKTSGSRLAGFSHPGFSEMFRGFASYLSSGDASHKNNTEEEENKKGKGTDDDSETEIISNSNRHSFFIHVLDPCRVVEEDQAQAICMFLDELFTRL